MFLKMLLILLSTGIAMASEEVVIRPTLPQSTVKDYRAPATVTTKDSKGNTVIYQTLPQSTVRDYRAPAYVVEKKK